MIRKFLITTAMFLLFFFWDLTFGHSVKVNQEDEVEDSLVLFPLDLSNELFDFQEFSSFETTINRFINHWGVAGASVAISKDNELIYAKGFGYANREVEELMQPYHLLRVASVSKLITAVAAMKLVEKDLLSLNSKVFGAQGILNDTILYGYIDKRVEDITIEQLLNHSAGWTTRWGDHLFMHQSIARQMDLELPLGKDDIIRFALGKRLHFEPGARSSYNNLGYLILETVIEKIAGESYETYVNKNVFHPLGVYDAFLAHNYDSLRYPLEVRYYEVPEAETVPAFDGSPQMVYKSRGGNDVRTLGGAGGWVISASSLLRLINAIDPNSTERILTKESVNSMIEHEPGKHPLGWRWISVDGSRWRTGSFAGSSALAISRDDGFSFVFITNSSPWVGSKFPYEVNRMMNLAFRRVTQWPQPIYNEANGAQQHNYVLKYELIPERYPFKEFWQFPIQKKRTL